MDQNEKATQRDNFEYYVKYQTIIFSPTISSLIIESIVSTDANLSIPLIIFFFNFIAVSYNL